MRGLIAGLTVGALIASGFLSATTAFANDKDGGPCYVAKHVSKYPGDAASATDLATWMAAGAALAGLPPELPVMAALVESGIRNVPAGDGDSAGYFQMRLSIWNRASTSALRRSQNSS